MFKFIFLTLIYCNNISFADGISDIQLDASDVFSPDTLSTIYEKDGLDPILSLFYGYTQSFIKIYRENKVDSMGYKLKQDEVGFKKLGKLIQTSNYITKNFDRAGLHYNAYSLLYKEFPKDVSLSIGRSGLSVEDRTFMLNTLKNHLE